MPDLDRRQFASGISKDRSKVRVAAFAIVSLPAVPTALADIAGAPVRPKQDVNVKIVGDCPDGHVRALWLDAHHSGDGLRQIAVPEFMGGAKLDITALADIFREPIIRRPA